MLRAAIVTILCLATTTTTVAQDKPKKSAPDPVGLWLGALPALPLEARVVMQIDTLKGGGLSAKWIRIDEENQELLFEKTVLAVDKLTLEAHNGELRFIGKFTDKGGIAGELKRGPQSAPVHFRRIDKIPVLKRPQTPTKPYPYASEDIRFENAAAKIQLAGTLTLPKGNGPCPGVVLVSGSGPHDRDHSVFSHKPFLVLADHLARNGIATLRYDDRGVGQSGGQFAGATTQDFALDAESAVRFLSGHKKIDLKRIGICGISEGGAIAPLVAVARPKDVAFIILLAGPGVPGDRVAYEQLMMSNAPADRKFVKELWAAAVPILRSAKTTEQAKEKLKAAMDQVIAKEKDGTKRKDYESILHAQIEKLSDPWVRWFVGYDPAPTLQRVACRVLALYGDKDLLLNADENLAAVAAALKTGGNTNAMTLKLKGLDHNFQTSKTGRLEEYRDNEESIAPAVLTLISDWILGRK